MKKASKLASSSSTDHVPAGRIGRPHGLHGEVTILPEDPRWFAPGSQLWADDRCFTVASSQKYRDRGLTVRFEGISDRPGAETLRGIELTVAMSERPELEAGEYWPEDLVGLSAVDPSGNALGEVVAIAYGPQDRLVVQTPEGARVEVPFVGDLVGDPKDGEIVIDAPGGMFDTDA